MSRHGRYASAASPAPSFPSFFLPCDVAKGDVTGDGGKSEQTVEGEESGGSEEADHLALGDGK